MGKQEAGGQPSFWLGQEVDNGVICGREGY